MAVSSTARSPSWLLIAAALPFVFMFVLKPVRSAPTENNENSNALESYDGSGCYYNYQHYGEGDRIITNEPCLNCTCHNRMLMCYLRVCPFTKAIGQDCTVEKKPDQCCPVITCPEVPVQLLENSFSPSTTSRPSSEHSTAVGHPDSYGCSIDNEFYADGAQVPADRNKPCELCYCIRNHTACVMQECTLQVEGCKPVYQDGVCCPVRYECEYPEETTTLGSIASLFFTTTTTMPPNTMCRHNGEEYADGALIQVDDKPCEHCYCMRGEIVCAVQECGTPLEREGHNCTALPTQPGKCCPEMYQCDSMPAQPEVSSDPSDEVPLQVQHDSQSSGVALNADEDEKNQEIKTESPDHHSSVEEKPEMQADNMVHEEEEDKVEVTTLPPSLIEPAENEKEAELEPTKQQEESGEVSQNEPGHSEIQHEPTDAENEGDHDESAVQHEPTDDGEIIEELHHEEVQKPAEPQVDENTSAQGVTQNNNDVEQVTPVQPGSVVNSDDTTVHQGQDNQEQPNENQQESEPAQQKPITHEDASETNNDQPSENAEETTQPQIEVHTEQSLEDSNQEEDHNENDVSHDQVKPEQGGVEINNGDEQTEHKPDSASGEPESTTQFSASVQDSVQQIDEEKPYYNNEAVTSEATTEVNDEVQPPSELNQVQEKPVDHEVAHEEEIQHEPIDAEHENDYENNDHHVQEVEDKKPESDDIQIVNTEASNAEKEDHTEPPKDMQNDQDEDHKEAIDQVVEVSEVDKFEEEAPATSHPTTESQIKPDSENVDSSLNDPEEETETGEDSSLNHTEKPQEVSPETGTEPSETEGQKETAQNDDNAEGEINEVPSHVNVEHDVEHPDDIPTAEKESEPAVVNQPSEHHEVSNESEPEIMIGTTESPIADDVAEIGSETEKDETDVHAANIPIEEVVPPVTESIGQEISSTEKTEVESSKPVSDAIDDMATEQDDNPLGLEVVTEKESDSNPSLNEDDEITTDQPIAAAKPSSENVESASESNVSVGQPISDEIEGDHEQISNEPHLENSGETVSITESEQIVESTDSPQHDSEHEVNEPSSPLSPNFDEAEHSSDEAGSTDSSLAEISTDKPVEQIVPEEPALEVDDTNIPNVDHISIVETMTKAPMVSDSLVHEKVPEMEIEKTTEKQDHASEKVPDITEVFEEVSKLPSISNLTPDHPVVQDMDEVNNYEDEGNYDFIKPAISTPAEEEKEDEKVANTKPAHSDHVQSSEEVTEAGEEVSTETVQESHIPGEGDCNVDNIIYKSGEKVPVSNDCQKECECKNSIVHCHLQECPPPPSNDRDCMPVIREGNCCPSYTCENEPSYAIVTDVPNADDSAQDNQSGEKEETSTDAYSTDAPIPSSHSTSLPVGFVQDEIKPDIVKPIVPEESSDDELPGMGSHPAQIPMADGHHQTGVALDAGEDENSESLVHSDHPAQSPQYGDAVDDQHEDKKPETEVVTDTQLNSETTESSGSNDVSADDAQPDNTHGEIPDVHQPSSVHPDKTEEQLDVTSNEPASTDAPLEAAEISFTSPPQVVHEVHTEGPTPAKETEASFEPEAQTEVPQQLPSHEIHSDDFTSENNKPFEPEAIPIVTDAPETEKEIVTDSPLPSDSGINAQPESHTDVDSSNKPELFLDEPNEDEKEHATFKPDEIAENIPEIPAIDELKPVDEEQQQPTEGPMHEPEVGNHQTPIGIALKPEEFEHEPTDEHVEHVPETPEQPEAEISPAEPSQPPKEQTANNQEQVAEVWTTMKPEEIELVKDTEAELVPQQPAITSDIPSESTQNENDVQSTDKPIEFATFKPEFELEPSAVFEGHEGQISEEPKPDVHAPVEHKPEEHEILSQTFDENKPEEHVSSENKPEEHQPEEHTSAEKTPEDQAPAEHKPEEHTPVEHKPEEHTPAEHVSEEHTPVELKPEEHTPVEHQPEEHTSVENKPEEHTPAEHKPEEYTPVELKPEEHTSAENKPEEHFPVEHKPDEHAPAEHTPEELAPVEHKPDEHAPAEHTPEELAPVEHIPEEHKPITGLPEAIEQTPAEQKPSEHTPEEQQPIDHASEAQKPVDQITQEHIPEDHLPENEQSKPIIPQEEEHEEEEEEMYKPGLPQYPDMPGLPYEPEEMFGGSFPDMPPMGGYDEEQSSFGPGTCRYGGKVYLSAQQIPRDDPCDFCFCFRSDIICLQQSCPPPIKGCHEEAIDGFCCPRYECPVPMGIMNATTTTTTTTAAPDIASFIYHRSEVTGCLVQGNLYRVGEEITSASGPCLDCRCGGDNKMRCEPKACSPQPLLRKMIEAVSLRR